MTVPPASKSRYSDESLEIDPDRSSIGFQKRLHGEEAGLVSTGSAGGIDRDPGGNQLHLFALFPCHSEAGGIDRYPDWNHARLKAVFCLGPDLSDEELHCRVYPAIPGRG